MPEEAAPQGDGSKGGNRGSIGWRWAGAVMAILCILCLAAGAFLTSVRSSATGEQTGMTLAAWMLLAAAVFGFGSVGAAILGRRKM